MDKKCKFLINLLFFVSILLLAVFCVKYLFFWILPFFIGFAIAFFLRPAITWVTDKTILPKKCAAVTVITAAYALLVSLLWLAGVKLFSEAGALFLRLPDLYSAQIEPLFLSLNQSILVLYQRLSPDAAQQLSSILAGTAEQAKNFIMGLSQSALSALTEFLKSLPNLLLTLAFSIISSYLISMDYQSVASFLVRQLPKTYQPWLIESKNFLVGSLFKFIRAYLIILMMTFAELALGLSLLRVESAILLSALIAVLDILPLIGTGGIMLPWAAFCFLDRNYFLGTGLLLLWGIISIVRTFLEPKIVGNQIGLHPLVTLTGMFFGYKLFGFLGLLLMPMVILLLQYLNDTGKIKLWKI